ncbi:MAG TPA: IS200/IS605 family transposase [Candidatus Acetothermia bacterium]|nr:IS200/IS605 family transposase [Candidatus Acetothermia bacterium]
MGSVRRTRHAVYDLKYHFVWIPKYRKLILKGCVAEGLKEFFEGIAKRYELEIDMLEVMPDHVHLFLLAPPKYSPSQVVQIMKSVSAREMFHRYPWLREKL